MRVQRLAHIILLAFAMTSTVAAARPANGLCGARSNFLPSSAEHEIEWLEGREIKHHPDRVRSEQLAQLTIIAAGGTREAQCRHWRHVVAARSHMMKQMRDVMRGQINPYWNDNRWIKDHRAATSPEARQLFLRVFVDQFHGEDELDPLESKSVAYLYNYQNEQLIRQNATWLKRVLRRIGWYDMRRYGGEASQGAWLLVQHADYDVTWQAHILERLRPKVQSGDMQPSYFAYLADRVATNQGKPQEFGTQGRCQASGEWRPFETIDPATLDTRRASISLEPMATYKARFHCRVAN
jgi:hypothetical protein